MGMLTGITTSLRIVFIDRRIPGRIYQLYFNLLSKVGRAQVTLRTKNGMSVRAFTKSISMYYETWSKRDYDIPGFVITNDMTVVDIGANQGFFSLYAASKGATVYAFEPCAENFDVLKWNVSSNSLQDHVKIFNVAVAGHPGNVPLFVGVDSSGLILSGSVSICNEDRGGTEVKRYLVECVTLDSLLDELQIENCDFLKIDCEGAEYEILRATSPRAFGKIARIAMECHDNRIGDAAAILKQNGFQIISQTYGWTGMLKAQNMHLCGV